MSAPANDQWANAYLVTSNQQGAVTGGTNEGATAEPGEPANNGKTVWWAWICPQSGDYFWSTDGSTNTYCTTFRSVIQAFTGSSVSALSQVAYLENQIEGVGNGWSYGARIAFTAAAGTTYYIRVDTRDGSSGAIFLAYGPYYTLRLGPCSGCAFDFSADLCVGTVTIADVTKQGFYTFGTFPPFAGNYRVKYCGGTLFDGTNYHTFAGMVAYNGMFDALIASMPQQIAQYNPSGGTSYMPGDPVFSGGVDSPVDAFGQVLAPGIWYADLSVCILPTPSTSPYGSNAALYWTRTSGGSGPVGGDWTPYTTYNIGDTSEDDLFTYTAVQLMPSYAPCGYSLPYPSHLSSGSIFWLGDNNTADGYGTNAWVADASAATPEAAQAAGLCNTSPYFHQTKKSQIGMVWIPYQDWSWYNTASNPTVQLMQEPFLISQLSTAGGFGLSGSGTSWSAGFGITNTSPYDFDDVIVTLMPGSGITNPSASVVVTLDSGVEAVAAFTFTADPTAGFTTAILQVSRNGVVVGVLEYPLYPIFSVAISSLNYFEKDCSGTKYWASKVVCTRVWPPGNMDAWGSASAIVDPVTGIPSSNNLTIGMAAPGSINMYNHASGSPCVIVASLSELQPGSYYTFTMDAGFEAGETAREVGLYVTFAWQVSPSVTIALPAAPLNLQVPPA